MFAEWAREGTQLIAPAFFDVETDSILRQKVMLRQERTPAQAETAWMQRQRLPSQQLSSARQRLWAWEIAMDFGLATVYDATSLALADLRGREFRTADKRLVDRVQNSLDFVKWLGDYVPRSTSRGAYTVGDLESVWQRRVVPPSLPR